MKQFLKRTFISSLLFPAFYFAGCMDIPDGFEAPKWDVNLSTPVMDTTYTLEDAIKRDPDMIKWYAAGSEKENLLYYADNKEIEKVTIGDKLKLDKPVESSQAQTIGQIKIADLPSKSASISSSWTHLQAGQSFPIPSVSNIPIDIVFPQVQEYNYLILSSGSLDLNLTNVMDVPVTLSDCYLQNNGSNIRIGEPGYSISIPAKSSRYVSIPLKTGISIANTIGFHGSLSTPGSNGSQVYIPSSSIDINAYFKNLSVDEVQGKLNENYINISKSFVIDDQTKFQNVVLDRGSLDLSLTNNIDVDLNVKVRLKNLYSSSSSYTPFEITLPVYRKSTRQISQALNGFVLRSGSALPTNVVDYDVIVSTSTTSDLRTVRSTDDIMESVKMSDLSLRSITGVIKPTELEIAPTVVSIKLGELQDKFKFTKLNFKDPSLKLYLNPSSQFKAKVNGTIKAKGYSSTLKFSDYIYNLGGQSKTTIEVPSADLSAFISSFSPNFPSELTITGTATINPDGDQNTIYTISQDDYITGNAEITFPLNVGVEDGQFADTTEINITDIKDQVNKVQSVILTVQITNGIPAKVKFEGAFMDATKSVKLLDLPPNRQDGNRFIELEGASVDANGKVTAPTVKTETIEFTGSDVDKFVNTKYILSNVTINTTGATTGSAAPVEFKVTDSIKIRASAKLVYRVNE
ncbi:MAG: hypothetical protein HF314_08380 [Ignavibacteria bacterium]|jgi:hypothetical protein|nr:hypothetical protein [Ignavibacteria bacterium]MCU7503075.1 hypothetical protein [Ignavibacteria bacterium]MCU7516505.1 hypothetical protein [Ignavibacteria bacterium]